MSGFKENEGIIVMAATNRLDVLDEALLRPGRFDRHIEVGLPDVKARQQILNLHGRKKPLDRDVDLQKVAQMTVYFSGAKLENLMNEAALLAARRRHAKISMDDVEDAMLKVVVGVEKKSKVVSEKEKRLTAFHEAGHAIVIRNLPTQDPVHQISIIPRGMAGGYTYSLPREDKSYMSKNEMFEEIVSLLGVRVAESLCLDDISTGASNDIERATSIARKMVTKYGMSDRIGPITFGAGHDEVFLGRDFATQRNYSENIASIIDEEIKNIVDTAYDKAKNILEEYKDKLNNVALKLIENEKMSSDEFNAIFS
jgi:cell division protease FtsH